MDWPGCLLGRGAHVRVLARTIIRGLSAFPPHDGASGPAAASAAQIAALLPLPASLNWLLKNPRICKRNGCLVTRRSRPRKSQSRTPSLHVAVDATHDAHDIFDNIGAGQRAPQLLWQSEPVTARILRYLPGS